MLWALYEYLFVSKFSERREKKIAHFAYIMFSAKSWPTDARFVGYFRQKTLLKIGYGSKHARVRRVYAIDPIWNALHVVFTQSIY